MAHPFKVATLPQAIRERLHTRLIENHFGGLVELSAWLTTEGYPVGKSALGRYALACRAEIEADVAAAKNDATMRVHRDADLRIRVLELAAGQPGPEDLITRAERLLAWVRGG